MNIYAHSRMFLSPSVSILLAPPPFISSRDCLRRLRFSAPVFVAAVAYAASAYLALLKILFSLLFFAPFSFSLLLSLPLFPFSLYQSSHLPPFLPPGSSFFTTAVFMHHLFIIVVVSAVCRETSRFFCFFLSLFSLVSAFAFRASCLSSAHFVFFFQFWLSVSRFNIYLFSLIAISRAHTFFHQSPNLCVYFFHFFLYITSTFLSFLLFFFSILALYFDSLSKLKSRLFD